MSVTGNILSTLVGVASDVKTLWQFFNDHGHPVLKIQSNTPPEYGWRDNIREFVLKGSGTDDPAWTVFSDGTEGYSFSATAKNRVLCNFHIDHDYALGTVLYPHVHWEPVTNDTGTVRWGIEYRVAKGHQQGAASTFSAPVTVYVEQTISSALPFMHHIAEVSLANAIPALSAEPDTVIKMKVFRDAAHASDTFTGAVHAWQADLHYQTDRIATKNKAPDFYA